MLTFNEILMWIWILHDKDMEIRKSNYGYNMPHQREERKFSFALTIFMSLQYTIRLDQRERKWEGEKITLWWCLNSDIFQRRRKKELILIFSPWIQKWLYGIVSQKIFRVFILSFINSWEGGMNSDEEEESHHQDVD